MNKSKLLRLSITIVLSLCVLLSFAEMHVYFDTTISVGMEVTYDGDVPSNASFDSYEGYYDPANSDRTTIKIFEPKFYAPSTVVVQSMKLLVDYTDQEIAGMNENDLQLYEYSEIEGTWTRIQSSIDQTNNRISANLNIDYIGAGAFGLVHEPGSGSTPNKNIVFKNASNNKFSIASNSVSFKISHDKYIKCKLLNLQGKELQDLFDGIATAGLNTINIDSDLGAGIYLIAYSENGNIQLYKYNQF